MTTPTNPAATDPVGKEGYWEKAFSNNNEDLDKSWTSEKILDIDYMAKYGDFDFYSFKDPNGGNSNLAWTNGINMMGIINDNLHLQAGKPGNTGCGGKLVISADGGVIQQTGSQTIEVVADDLDETAEQSGDGNISKEKTPAYSLKVYGDCYIESIGGNVIVKGDNVMLNAVSNLTLKSDKDIQIQAGSKGDGRILMNAASIEQNASFLKQNITGSVTTEGAGAVENVQYNPLASMTTSSAGYKREAFTGNLEFEVAGNFNHFVFGNYHKHVQDNHSIYIGGDKGELIEGKFGLAMNGAKKSKLPPGTGIKPDEPNFKFFSGPQVGSLTGIEINSVNNVEVKSLSGDIELAARTNLSKLKLGKESVELNYLQKASIKMGPEATEVKNNASKLTLGIATTQLSAPAIFLN